MVRMKANAQVGWKVGVLVICWEEFGEIWWSVVLGISEEVVLGCCCGFQVVGGDSGLIWSWNGGEGIAGSWWRLGDEFRRELEELEGLVSVGRGGGNATDFGRGMRRGMLGFLLAGCSLSRLAKGIEGCWDSGLAWGRKWKRFCWLEGGLKGEGSCWFFW